MILGSIGSAIPSMSSRGVDELEREKKFCRSKEIEDHFNNCLVLFTTVTVTVNRHCPRSFCLHYNHM
jgi:hypothetical protein